MFTDEIEERRLKPRVDGSIPVTVRGKDTSGVPFEIQSVLDNLSAGGLHMFLERPLEVESSLSALIWFAGMEIEASGVVRRVEPMPDGSFGFGMAFESYRVSSAQRKASARDAPR